MVFLFVLFLSFFLQWWFARKDATYDWAGSTISELGQIDGPLRWQVALYYFLPVAALLLVAMSRWWQAPYMHAMPLSLMLLVPIAYLVAAIFPCDKGAPLWGSFSNRIHMLFGLLEYIGAGIGFIWLSFNASTVLVITLRLSFAIVVLGLVLLSIPFLQRFRGIVQRIMEASLFISFFLIDSHF